MSTRQPATPEARPAAALAEDAATVLAIPETAVCRGCGYRLRGLPRAVCPECSRAFDPSDPTTFLPRPRRVMARRVAKILGVVALLVLAYALFGPRGMLGANLTLSCVDCGEEISCDRSQLEPPGWIGLRYPGHTLMTRRHGTTKDGAPCSHRFFKASAMRRGGGGGSVSSPSPHINGEKVTPETAEGLLYRILRPDVVRWTFDGGPTTTPKSSRPPPD